MVFYGFECSTIYKIDTNLDNTVFILVRSYIYGVIVSGIHRSGHLLLRLHRVRHNRHDRRGSHEPQAQHPHGHCHQPGHHPGGLCHHLHDADPNW